VETSNASDRREVGRSDLEDRLILRAWEDEEFRRALLRDPHSVISQELTAMSGRPLELSARLKIYIHEESPSEMHIVLPYRRDDLAEDGQTLLVGWEKLLG
jgi:hypothetical protein